MIVWLASYPKSGNTWVRSFLISILFNKKKDFNLKDLNLINQYPSRRFFKNFINNPLDIHEVKKNWLITQDKINSDKKIKFFKTHNSLCNLDNYYFTNFKNSLGAIYIVRDPRNLISSISNHFSKTIEEAKNFILTPKIIAGRKKDGGMKKDDIKTLIGTWSEHYKFWKKNDNYLLIKYEDLIKNPSKELDRIIFFLSNFIKINTNKIKNENIINSTSFEKLKSLENEGKFKESAYDNSGKIKNFFHKGPENKWQNQLDINVKNEIEDKLYVEMKELGYL